MSGKVNVKKFRKVLVSLKEMDFLNSSESVVFSER